MRRLVVLKVGCTLYCLILRRQVDIHTLIYTHPYTYTYTHTYVGGLLASIPASESRNIRELLQELLSAGYHKASVIGCVGKVKDFRRSGDDDEGLVWLV